MKSERSTLKRLPSRGFYDLETIYRILDQNFLCHIAWSDANGPHCIPTAYGRDGNRLFIHGSIKSGMLEALLNGVEVAVNIMQLDGIVLARSLFHSSMNYQSVSLYGRCKEVTGVKEKAHALKVISESIWKGRWEEARQPGAGELAATAVIEIPVTEGAAKIRSGPANDNEEDKKLNVWAGVVPIIRSYGAPVANPDLDEHIKLPPTLSGVAERTY